MNFKKKMVLLFFLLDVFLYAAIPFVEVGVGIFYGIMAALLSVGLYIVSVKGE